MKLAYNVFRPHEKTKGAVAIVHGMAEHRKRYAGFAEYLADSGYGVITYDLPGHGESVSEEKGHFGDDGWQTLVESAGRAVRRAKTEFPDVKIVLFGHSMGSMIARCYLQDHDSEIDGLILSGAPNWQRAAAAGIALGKQIRGVKGKKGFSKVMDKLITGNFNKAVENPSTGVDWLSYNEENVKQYLEDPECGFGFTVQGYLDELEGMEQMHKVEHYHCTKPKMPVAFFAGKEDPCIGGQKGFADSVGTLKSAGYRHISTRLYPKMRHEILHETDSQRVYRDIKNWLDANIAA